MNAFEQSGKEEYLFLTSIVGLIKPRKILEIGTSSGHGTLALAQNAPEGAQIITVDIADTRIEAVKKKQPRNIHIHFIQNDSHIALNNFIDAGAFFDLILIDGGHLYEIVKKDWNYASQLSETVILHDALQFNGVQKVINTIRRDPAWDVSVLSYPGTTSKDHQTGREYFSKRCPGIAIATTKKTIGNGRFLKNFLEHPTANSQRAFKRRKKTFLNWHTKANRKQDLSFADWEMIFHTLWNLKPDVILHIGHIGSGATLLFMEFAKASKTHFFGVDPTEKFWPKNKPLLPPELIDLNSTTIFKGASHIEDVLNGIQNNKKIFLWVDEFYDAEFYGPPLQSLLSRMPEGSISCIRNFSPYDGSPERVVIGDAESTNPRASSFCDWLSKQPYSIRLASPEATFGDYVNAGHWIMVHRTTL